jgi:IS30 family transposase
MTHRLTDEEKKRIDSFATIGVGYCTIAKRIGRHRNTIRRYLQSEVRERQNRVSRKRYQKDSERKKVTSREWRQKNAKKVQHRYQKNKRRLIKRITERTTYRRRHNIQCRLACNLRSRMYQAVRRGTKSGSAVRDLGCTIAELKTWIESNFVDGMSWDNWGEWHIDHVRPLASFDLTDRIQFLQACHFTNLQPLWAKDNLRKNCS